jgi:triphosphoribosyl-dephospho-CoA synthase
MMHIATTPDAAPSPPWPAARRLGALMHRALLVEVTLTPKPGLVDRRNTGAHADMDLATFRTSARAIAPWFPRFVALGRRTADLAGPDVLSLARRDGLACEQAMFAATGGVNTHKGSIFSFGLLATAAGRLLARGQPPRRDALCAEVALLCDGLVGRDLPQASGATAGERLFQRYGLTGARGEAASGFATVRHHALPAYLGARAAGRNRQDALLEALLTLLAVNPDTNLVARGGLDGLDHVRHQARRLLAEGATATSDLRTRLACFDDDLIARNLSPGGSADLLAVTWFLAMLPAGPHPDPDVQRRGTC